MAVDVGSLLDVEDSLELDMVVDIMLDVEVLLGMDEDEQFPAVPELMQTQTAFVESNTASNSENGQAPITQDVALFVIACLFAAVHWQT
jgi:hypothetical protein